MADYLHETRQEIEQLEGDHPEVGRICEDCKVEDDPSIQYRPEYRKNLCEACFLRFEERTVKEWNQK